MLFKEVALTIAFAATALGAVIPTVENTHSHKKRDHAESVDIWQTSKTATEEYSQKTDNEWKQVHLKFPMTIFNKSATYVYFSMNGLISLDKPTKALSVPEKDFPIDSAVCNKAGSSCIPDNTVALLWQDLFMPKNGSYSVSWVYHDAVLAPQIRRHYHFTWSVCDKAGALTATGECSPSATRFFQMNYYENAPGVFHILYYNAPKDSKLPGIVGAQSYPQYLQVQDIPHTVRPDEGFSISCLILDTSSNTIKYPTKYEDC
ncbi:hypothetical protein ABW20_dc0104102 [Dactylellina cionopaga]|nr:hypothetical protein ABW20_dc0104102 [Dactylellina cionopaga]